MTIFFFLFFFSLIFLVISLFFSFKKKEIFQIESGFQTLSKTSLKSFSINFFFILIIFIIFDLEILLALPTLFKKNFFLSFTIFFFINITLFIDWFMNKIIWKN